MHGLKRLFLWAHLQTPRKRPLWRRRIGPWETFVLSRESPQPGIVVVAYPLPKPRTVKHGYRELRNCKIRAIRSPDSRRNWRWVGWHFHCPLQLFPWVGGRQHLGGLTSRWLGAAEPRREASSRRAFGGFVWKWEVQETLFINWPFWFGTNTQRICVDSEHRHVEIPGCRTPLLKLILGFLPLKYPLFFYKPEWKAISLVVLPLGHWCGNPAFGRSPTDGQNDVVFVYWKK